MTSTSIQASLYPARKYSLSKKSLQKNLAQLQEILGVGNIIWGKTWHRLVTPNIEILCSSKGCVEVYGDSKDLEEVLLLVINLAKINGYSFQWLFLDSEEPNAKSKKMISQIHQELKLRQEIHNIQIGGEG